MTTRSIITLPYQVARTPLAIFDVKVMHRLADDSRGRLAFERAFGSLDLLAGRLLHDEGLKQQGSERVERAERLDRAVDLEADAAERRRAASEAARAGEQAAAEKRERAQETVSEGVREAAKTEAEGKQQAARKSRAQASKAKKQAATRANQKLSTIRQGLEQTEAITEAREHQAEAQAKAELDEAAQEKASAREARNDADQLAQLADAKKAGRVNS